MTSLADVVLWVAADVEAAAASLRGLFLDRDRARLLGERAQKDVAKKLEAAGVDRWMRGLESASDHAPTWITLK